MADRSLTYVVKIDSSSAAAQAAQLRAAFQSELQNIQINLLDPGALNRALSATQTIRSEYAQIAQQAQLAGQHLSQINATQLQTQYATPIGLSTMPASQVDQQFAPDGYVRSLGWSAELTDLNNVALTWRVEQYSQALRSADLP